MTGRSLIVLLIAASFLAPAALAQQQFTFLDETFSTGDRAALKLDVGDADVQVDTDRESGIRVMILVEARNEDRARRYFEAQRFDV